MDQKSIITLQLTSHISTDVCNIVIQYCKEVCLFGCKTKCNNAAKHLSDTLLDISTKGIGFISNLYWFKVYTDPVTSSIKSFSSRFPELPIEDNYSSQLFCLNCGSIDLEISDEYRYNYLFITCECNWKMFTTTINTKPLLDNLNYILYHHKKMIKS